MKWKIALLTLGLLALGMVPAYAQHTFDGNIIWNNGGVVRDQCGGLGTQLVYESFWNDIEVDPKFVGNPLYPGNNWVVDSTSIASGWHDCIATIQHMVADDCDTCGCERVFEQVCYRGAIPPLGMGEDWTRGWICDTAFAAHYGGPLPALNYFTFRTGVQATQTWVADSVYVLQGKVFFPSGTTLTVEPGTRIIGENASSGFLVINRGAKIYAIGTKDQPIVATTDLNPPTIGGWGGIVMHGSATSNCNCDGCLTDTDSCASEGGNAGFYCGSNDCDDSGELKYVRVQYSGVDIAVDNELNCFTWNGIGCETRLSYLNAFMGKDDLFEWFGGKANAHHLVGTGGGDDGLDWQLGFRGTIQFAVIQQYRFQGDKGIEADNSEYDFDACCRSNPLIANVTLIGPEDDTTAASPTYGIHLRRGTDAHIFNSIIAYYPNQGIRYEHSQSCARGKNPQVPAYDCGAAVGVDMADGADARPMTAWTHTSPNPVRDKAKFFFRLPAAGHTTLTVYDARGRQVDKVVDSGYAAGEHQVTWTPGSDMASGVYFYRLDTSNGPVTGRFTVLR